MIKRLVIVVIALAVVFGGIFGWKYLQFQRMAAQMSQPQPPATVAAAEVRIETWQPYLRGVGSLVASQGVSVTNEVPGQVNAILFESGQAVEKGDVILQLDDSVDEAELQGLIAERHLAELEFARAQRLIKQRSVSQATYDEAQARLESARANVASKRAVIDKKKIRAPFAGRLGIRQADLGQYLPAGSPIAPLQALEPIYVDYTLPERHYAAVRVGQRVKLKVQAYPEREFEGEITAINPGVEAGSRSVRLRATLSNTEHLLRPGMFAEVRTVLPAREGILTLPRTAITYNPYGDSVFVITDEDDTLTVQRRQITTGDVRDGRVEIIKGLEAGERVVAAGHVKLRNGQTVTIDNSVELDPEQVVGG